MEIKKTIYATGTKEDYLTELFAHEDDVSQYQFGTAILNKGMKTPINGDFTRHNQIKIVYLIEGRAELQLEGDPNKYLVEAGDFFKMDRFEGHSSIILEDVKLVYVLFSYKEDTK